MPNLVSFNHWHNSVHVYQRFLEGDTKSIPQPWRDVILQKDQIVQVDLSLIS